MNRVTITALGSLREKIPTETKVELDQMLTAFEFVEKHFGIHKTESRMAFIINGRMETGAYLVRPGDTIKVLKMGGAG